MSKFKKIVKRVAKTAGKVATLGGTIGGALGDTLSSLAAAPFEAATGDKSAIANLSTGGGYQYVKDVARTADGMSRGDWSRRVGGETQRAWHKSGADKQWNNWGREATQAAAMAAASLFTFGGANLAYGAALVGTAAGTAGASAAKQAHEESQMQKAQEKEEREAAAAAQQAQAQAGFQHAMTNATVEDQTNIYLEQRRRQLASAYSLMSHSHNPRYA